MGRVGGHMHYRQRCSYKFESVIPYSDKAQCYMDGLFVILFIHARCCKTIINLNRIGRWFGRVV